MAIRLMKYGLKDGILVSVENVASGLQCGCKCPSCGALLIARKGEKREHHFAHYGDTVCSHGCESALHLMAKQLMASRRELFIPDEAGGDVGVVRSFTTVELESREYTNVIPDVVMKNGNELLCVEVLVTHAVDEEKLRKLTEGKLPTVEIDLSDLLDNYDETSVTEALLNGRHTKWIYNKTLADKWEKQKVHRRRQKVIDEICDYLPCVSRGKYREDYDCLKEKRRVSIKSCHACRYFIHNSSRNTLLPPLPCCFRERELLKLSPDDCRAVERKDGILVSIEVLIDGEWQRWAGIANNIVIPGQPKESAGKTVFQLWKPEYSAMVVRRISDGQEMIINGKGGQMFTKQKGIIIGKYRNKDQYGNFYYSSYYPVRGAEKSIWELEIAYPRSNPYND